MTILFSNPPWWEGKESRGFFKRKRWRRGVRAGSRWPFTYQGRCSPDNPRARDYIPYPFFMGYAATYIGRKIGNEKVFFRDSIALSESYKSYFSYLDSIKSKIEYLLIESATPSWDHDLNLIKEIKSKYPHIKIIVSGPIAFKPLNELIEKKILHAVLKGEYEKNTSKVIDGKSGLIEHDLLTLEEMNKAPFPYFDKTIFNKYVDGNPIPMGKYNPQAHIWSSRGCPFKCIFCVWPGSMTGNDPDGDKKRSVRQYNKNYMKNFISHLDETYNFETYYFDDDTFNLGNKHTTDMCEVMSEIKKPWFAMCRADTIRKDTWKIMRDSNCKGVKLGFESGSQYVVDQIVNKHLDLKFAKDIVIYLRSLGLSVHGTFTYGLPGETKENMIQTKKYISGVPFSTIQESGTAEIEGTPLYNLNKKDLDAYPGAKIDKNYQRHIDGSKKWKNLVSDLQDN